MPFSKINRRAFTQEFFAWWGVYIVFLTLVMLVMRFTGHTHNTFSHDFLLSVDLAAFAALMAVSHYYLLFREYFLQKKYLVYIVLDICLVGVFILLDALLFWVQTGGGSFSGSFVGMLHVNFKRVLIAYIPLTIVYTIYRSIQGRKKEGKID